MGQGTRLRYRFFLNFQCFEKYRSGPRNIGQVLCFRKPKKTYLQHLGFPKFSGQKKTIVQEEVIIDWYVSNRIRQQKE